MKQDDVEQAIFQYFSRKICSKLAVPLMSPVLFKIIKRNILSSFFLNYKVEFLIIMWSLTGLIY